MINLKIDCDIEMECNGDKYIGGRLNFHNYIIKSSHITIGLLTKIIIEDLPYKIETITFINGYTILEVYIDEELV